MRRRPRRLSVAAAACCLAVTVVVSAARTTQMTQIDDNYVPLNSLTIKALYENSTAETGSSHWWTQIESFQNSKTRRPQKQSGQQPPPPPQTASWNESASTAERIQMQALLDKFLSIYGETRVGGEPEVRPAQLKNALIYLANQFARDPRPSAETALISAALRHLDASFGDDFTYDDSTTPPNKRAVIWSVVERALAKYRLAPTTTAATTTVRTPERTSPPWTTQRWYPTTTTMPPELDEEGKKLPSFYPQLAAASAVAPLEAGASNTPNLTRNNSKVFSVKTNSSSISLDDLLRLRSTTAPESSTPKSKSEEGPHVGLSQHSIGEAGPEAGGNVVSPFLYEGPHPHIGFRHINKVSSPSSPKMENVTNAFLTTSPFLVPLEQNKPDVNYTSLKLIESPFLQTTPKGFDAAKPTAQSEEDDDDDYYEEGDEGKEQADQAEEGEWPRQIPQTPPPSTPPPSPVPVRQAPLTRPVPSFYPQLSNYSLSEASESAFHRQQAVEYPARPNFTMTMQSDLQQGRPLTFDLPTKIRSSSIFDDKAKVERFASSLNSFIQGLESNLNTSLGSGNLIISLENAKRQPAKDVSLTQPSAPEELPTLVKIVNYKNGSLDFVTRSSQVVPSPTPSRTSSASSSSSANSRPLSPLAPSRAQQIAAAVASATAAAAAAAPGSPTGGRRRKTASRTSSAPKRAASIPAPSALKSELGRLQFPVNIKSGLKPPSALSALFGPGVDMMMRQHPFTQDVTSSGPIDLPAQLRIHGNLNRYLHQQQPEVQPPPSIAPTEVDPPPAESSLGEASNPLNDDALLIEAILRSNFSAPPAPSPSSPPPAQNGYGKASRPDRLRTKDIFDREDPAKLRAKLDELEELRLQNKVLLSLLQMQGSSLPQSGQGYPSSPSQHAAESSRSQRLGNTHFKTPPVIEPLASIENSAVAATDFTILQPQSLPVPRLSAGRSS